jgi:hypothetical protein
MACFLYWPAVVTASVTAFDSLKFEVHAEVREILTCIGDIGSEPKVLTQRFPALTFSHLPELW